LTTQWRSQKVVLAIAQPRALARTGDAIGAPETIQAAAKKRTNPRIDLLLAKGRLNLKLNLPNSDEAASLVGVNHKSFEQANGRGQCKLKPLLAPARRRAPPSSFK